MHITTTYEENNVVVLIRLQYMQKVNLQFQPIFSLSTHTFNNDNNIIKKIHQYMDFKKSSQISLEVKDLIINFRQCNMGLEMLLTVSSRS